MALAVWTISWRRNPVITVVALKGAIPEVMGEGDTAVGTFGGKTTLRTEDEIGKSSAVEKEETLLFLGDIPLQGRLHLFREESLLFFHVHHLNRWKRPSFNSFG